MTGEAKTPAELVRDVRSMLQPGCYFGDAVHDLATLCDALEAAQAELQQLRAELRSTTPTAPRRPPKGGAMSARFHKGQLVRCMSNSHHCFGMRGAVRVIAEIRGDGGDRSMLRFEGGSWGWLAINWRPLYPDEACALGWRTP